jgi:hypothetical protein
MNTSNSNQTGMPRYALAALGLAGMFAWSGSAQVPLPVYEPFPAAYTNTSDGTTAVPAGGPVYPFRNLGNGATATLWSLGNSAGGGSAVVVGGAGLAYPGLYQDPAANVGLFIRTNSTTANRNRGILFPTNASGNVYLSFLLNVLQSPSPEDTVNPAFGRLFAKLDAYSNPVINNNSGSSSMAGVWLTTSNTLAISKSSNIAWGADSSTPLAAGTHLVVLRYRFNADADDDEVALWVDPEALGAPEGSVPAPALSLTAGTDVPSLSSMLLYHVGTEVVTSLFLDELRIATSWADATPTNAPCYGASISTPPASQSVNEGISAAFSCIPGGSTPTFQWQVSANGGGTWNNISGSAGGTSQNYLTPPTTPADSGKQFRVIASVACNNSSATSSVATLTVAPAVPTPVGLVVDDVFQDYWYNNLPYGLSNSVWFAGVASSLDASSGLSMLGWPQSGSVNWVGYFTDDSVTNLPVHLEVGRALKGTLAFNGSDITTNNGGVRIGFFDYADSNPYGTNRLTADGFGNAMRGQNVRGYMVALNYGTNFSGNPFSIYARNNLGTADLMGTTGDYLGLGGGPGGHAGSPAFQNTTNYTLDFTLARKAVGSVEITTSITGGGTNWTHTRTDTTYAYPRFDCIAFRASNAAQTASLFEFSRLTVQVISVAPNPIPLSIASANGNVTLTWTDPQFALQAAPSVTGTYTNVTGATSPYPVSTTGGSTFYRLHWSAQ